MKSDYAAKELRNGFRRTTFRTTSARVGGSNGQVLASYELKHVRAKIKSLARSLSAVVKEVSATAIAYKVEGS